MTFRGSRMHVLDWVEGAGGSFYASMNGLLNGTGFHVEEGSPVFPASTKNPNEVRLGKEYGDLLTLDQNRELLGWWLAKQQGANVPNLPLSEALHIRQDRAGQSKSAKAP